jgi:hypothetical protein
MGAEQMEFVRQIEVTHINERGYQAGSDFYPWKDCKLPDAVEVQQKKLDKWGQEIIGDGPHRPAKVKVRFMDDTTFTTSFTLTKTGRDIHGRSLMAIVLEAIGMNA